MANLLNGIIVVPSSMISVFPAHCKSKLATAHFFRCGKFLLRSLWRACVPQHRLESPRPFRFQEAHYSARRNIEASLTPNHSPMRAGY